MKSALVFVRPDAERGEIVVAGVVAESGVRLEPDNVLDELRQHLSFYKVPTQLEILDEADIPLLGSGKPDRRVVRERLVADADG